MAVDVRLPLKHSKKVHVGNDTEFVVLFKYDRLSMFCFLCGKLGHSNKFCELLFGMQVVSETKVREVGFGLMLGKAWACLTPFYVMRWAFIG